MQGTANALVEFDSTRVFESHIPRPRLRPTSVVGSGITFHFRVQINHKGVLREFQQQFWYDAGYIEKNGLLDCWRLSKMRFDREFAHVIASGDMLYNTIVGDLDTWYDDGFGPQYFVESPYQLMRT